MLLQLDTSNIALIPAELLGPSSEDIHIEVERSSGRHIDLEPFLGQRQIVHLQNVGSSVDEYAYPSLL